MDCVIADFWNSPMLKNVEQVQDPPQMFEQFFFETLPPVEGALSSIRKLIQSRKYDVHILSKPLKLTHFSYSEKAAWISKWFPELLSRLTLTQNKELSSGVGRILIDDNADEWGDKWEKAGGTFIHFEYSRHGDNRTEWDRITSQLLRN